MACRAPSLKAAPRLLCAELSLSAQPSEAPMRVITSVLPMVGDGGINKRAVRDVCPERLVWLVYVLRALCCAAFCPLPHFKGETLFVGMTHADQRRGRIDSGKAVAVG
ncbi:hypothetical protein BK142_18635 [Paenibacillus glucanolyticus]|nr:hypothetical protein BK142_18635 [Paenibacillus glucanolyticus]